MPKKIRPGVKKPKSVLSFYPGPSKVWEKVPQYTIKAYRKGILSCNHRSPEFEQLYRDTVAMLQKRLHIPQDYTILFTSSATECWEIIAQSLVSEKSLHVYNGAFGAKWLEYTQKLHPAAAGHAFGLEEEPDPVSLPVTPDTGLLAITHNETSNGTCWSRKALKSLRAAWPDKLIAVDATSSMGGVRLPFEQADVWYASVQKCFGLPAGMAVLVLSPKAVERARAINEQQHYNSLPYLLDHAANHQPGHTPNVLGIWLLLHSLRDGRAIGATERILQRQRRDWEAFLSGLEGFEPLIADTKVASDTVIPIKGEPDRITALIAAAKAAGFLLGKGYGDWKGKTFRIANFPQHTKSDMLRLQDFMQHWVESQKKDVS